jgi:hypothetical protein
MVNKRIGSISYVSNKKEYSVEIVASLEVIKYIGKTETALTCLIPDAGLLFEAELFDLLDTDNSGIPNKIFGTDFKLKFTEVIESLSPNDKFDSIVTEKKIKVDNKMRIKLRDNKEISVKYTLEKK